MSGSTGALLSRDETRILSWSDDKTVRLWDVATGRQIGPAMRHDGEVYGALLERDESRILSWSDDKTAAAVGRRDRPADRPGDDARRSGPGRAARARDESRILSWSDDKTAAAVGRGDRPPDRTRDVHDDEVYGALLGRDETRILSWSEDKTVRLWDVATGRQVGPPMMHDGRVTGALFSARREPHPVVVRGQDRAAVGRRRPAARSARP